MIFDGYRSISAHCRTESSALFSTFLSTARRHRRIAATNDGSTRGALQAVWIISRNSPILFLRWSKFSKCSIQHQVICHLGSASDHERRGERQVLHHQACDA